MKKLFLTSIFLISLFFPGTAFAQQYPTYSGYVNDFVGVLSPSFTKSLQQRLSEFEKRTTNQIAVVTVKTTAPEEIEGYSIHLADKWKVGQKGKDNGVIMLFAMDDRTMRIEVGRGLEGELTDIESKHILDDIIKPYFRQGKYEQGIDEGVQAVMAAIGGQLTITPVPTNVLQGGVQDFITIFIILIVFIVVLTMLSPLTPLGGQGTWGPTGIWVPQKKWEDDDNDSSGFGGFGGGGFSGGGATSRW